MRRLACSVLLAFGIPATARPCSCGPPKPACAYLDADAIFLGKVAFTEDGGSGLARGHVFVRFDVLESFKGLAPAVRQVWVDPESLGDCSLPYQLGETWLVFGRQVRFPKGPVSMSMWPFNQRKNRPLPAGMDLTGPPKIYTAANCSGTRRADYPSFEQDLAMLRTIRGGGTVPRVLGNVYLHPYRGWPVLNGPGLKGAWVTLHGTSVTLKATTDEKGAFSLKDAPAGGYGAWAYLPPFRTGRYGVFNIPEVGCGYVDIQLTTTTVLQGIVLDHRGRPATDVPVVGWLAKEKSRDALDSFALWANTDASGRFSIAGVPDEDFILSAGTSRPNSREPYRLVYYPGSKSRDGGKVFRLKPGQHLLNMVIWLDPPLEQDSVKTRVFDKSGNPAGYASVYTFKDGVTMESTRTDEHGFAQLPCYRGLDYELQAFGREGPTFTPISEYGKVPFKCGSGQAEYRFVLDRVATR